MSSGGFSDDRLSRILTAVETIEESLGILVRKQDVSRDAYNTTTETQDIVERRFVKMTEASIDIGEELVKHERGEPPESNPATMRALGELGILSSGLAEQMAQGARFRYVLSHTYGPTIDNDVVYNALQNLDRYRRFVQAIRDYLDSIGALAD